MRDHDDAALVDLNRPRERAERVAIQVVGRFVEDDEEADSSTWTPAMTTLTF